MTASKKENTSKYLVTQSNTLIEADYSQANLPAKTLKVGRLIVSKISPDDKDFRLIKVNNRAIKQYLGYKSAVPYNRFNSDLQDICKRLNDQPIRIRTEKDTILNAFFISSWEIDLKEGCTIFEISGRLKEYLLELKKNYTTYQLENIPKLNSSYSIRMYELLSQYRKIGKRKFVLEDLKRKIGCSYPLYGHFKKKALEKSQKDLKKYTDLRFEYEEKKTGRKVTALVLYIYPNDPQEVSKQGVLSFLDDDIEVEENKNFSAYILERLLSAGIRAGNIEKLWSLGFDIIEIESDRKTAQKRCKTVETYYLEKLTLLDQSKTKYNPAGFLIKALKENWVRSTIQSTSKPQVSSTRKKEKQLRKLENSLDTLKKEYRAEKAPIQEKLMSDENTFSRIYDSCVGSLGTIKSIVLKYGSPRQNYESGSLLRGLMHHMLEEQYPQEFEFISDKKQKIQDLEKEVKSLTT